MTWPPPGVPCEHAYPPGEFCPACGDVPLDQFDNVYDEHSPDCQCFACEEDAGDGEQHG